MADTLHFGGGVYPVRGVSVPATSFTNYYLSAVVEAETLNTTQSPLRDITKNTAADGVEIPLAYGLCRLGGLPFAINYSAATWTVGYVLCMGEISSYVKTLINGADPVAGVRIHYYTGTTAQTADSYLSAAISGYTDTLVISHPSGNVGIAYIVIQYTNEMYDAWPEVVCEIQAKKVRNPRALSGQSVLVGNDANYGVLTTPVSLVGYFEIELSFIRVDRSTSATVLIGNNSTSASDFIRYNAANHATYPSAIVVNYGGVEKTFAAALSGVAAAEHCRIKVAVFESNVYVFVNGLQSGAPQSVTVSSFTVDCIGSYNAGELPMPTGFSLGNVRIWDGVTLNEWRYDLDEGTGTAITGSHPSTIGQDGTWTAGAWAALAANKVYSENPGAHITDVIESPSYGLGRAVDNYSAIDVLDYCDDQSCGETRRTSYSVWKQATETEQIVTTMSAYAGCFVVTRGNVIVLKPDRAQGSVRAITAADIIAGSLTIRKKDSSDVPTVITATYTDTTQAEWREKTCDPAKAVGVDSGATQWRESHVQLGGINRHSQAYRECLERLNKLALADLEVSWSMFDEALTLEAGDVVTITHPYGLTAKLLRITTPPLQTSPGRWICVGSEYDPAAYSNEVATQPTYPDGNLPTGGAPGAPTGLTVGETTYQLLNGEYASRLDITWTAPASGLVTGYTVTVSHGPTVVWTGTSRGTRIATAPLQESVAYTITVSSSNALYDGDDASSNYTIIGKTAIPDPPATLLGFEAGGEVRLSWSKSTDVDAKRYEVRYGDTSGTWETAKQLDIVDGLRLITKDVPPSAPQTGGVWRFYVKTIDSIFQESLTAATVDIAVTLDNDSFSAGYIDPLTVGSTTLMHACEEVRGSGVIQYYSDGSDTWSSLYGSAAMSTFTNSMASYQTAAGTSYFYSTELDLLVDASGTFTVAISVTDHNGVATKELGLKPDAGAYTYGLLSQQGTARYAKVAVSSAGIFQIAAPYGSLRANVLSREEVGNATSNAGTPKTITLANVYASARSITLIAEGTTSLTCVYDNVVLGNPTKFDVYIFDAAGAQVAAPFRWSWKGV